MATEDAGAPLSDRQLLVAGVAGIALLIIAFVMPQSPWLPGIDAVTLGAVEGFTEFLPVSSTGHLLVVGRLLGLGTGELKEATDTYIVAIQVGAIAAVLGIYRQRIFSMLRGVVGRDEEGRRLLINIVVGFVPAGVVGLALSGLIKTYLFGIWPVIIAWAVGGVFLLVWRPRPGSTTLDMLTPRNALIIGAAQILAMWPGTSRSLVTIVAALAIGMTMASAIEFSFLLGLTTLSAATAFDLFRHGGELIDKFGIATPLLGAAVAFLDAYIAVNWFVAYLRTKPLTIFGWYRIAIAVVTTGFVAIGWV